jgi:ATP-dependent Clp protease protease subunit
MADVIPMSRGYEIKAKAREVDVWIYEEIGAGWFGGLSAKQFADDISALGKVDQITVRLNSPGGDVFDGIAIYNILKSNSARVVVNIDGLAASIASVIAMAGDEITMAENAMMMIHEAWTISMGNAGDFREVADRLEKVNGVIRDTYAKQTGEKAGPEIITGLMAAETWMTAQEALDYGLIHSTTAALEMAAHFDLDKFKFKKNPPVAGLPTQPQAAEPDKGEPTLPDVSCFDQAISQCERILKKEGNL